MKFKDFTQEAYDDIQSYMGGEEQWEEINKNLRCSGNQRYISI